MIKVGDRFETNNGGWCKVVEYINYDDITVEFEDTHAYRIKVNGYTLQIGNVKNPYAPRLFGVGYHGVGPHKSRLGSAKDGFSNLPAYSAWSNMLSRCYDKNYRDSRLYEATAVCEKWHCFQTFADWYTEQIKYTGWEDRTCLDKDILGDGNLYSENTCALVPALINSTIKSAPRGNLLQGVIKSSNGFYRIVPGYQNSKERFNSEGEAHFAYLKVKQKRLLELAEKYRFFLNTKVYDVLITKDYMYLWSPFFLNPNLK